MSTRLLAVPTIPVGVHRKADIAGLSFNIDTVYTTAIAAIVVLVLAFWLKAKVTSKVPNRVQIFWEFLAGSIGDQVESNLGPKYRKVVPLAMTIFILVLVADWIELLPGTWHGTDYLPSPSADVSFTFALGILVFVLTNYENIRSKGIGGYIKYFFRKPVAMFPLHVIEEITKPITLGLRLFGNIFAGSIMVALLLAFPGIVGGIIGIPLTVVWKLFDAFIGVVQAFIFALLTILYYQFAVSKEGH
jgi:F-type H+-transporting ATPase subunit a